MIFPFCNSGSNESRQKLAFFRSWDRLGDCSEFSTENQMQPRTSVQRSGFRKYPLSSQVADFECAVKLKALEWFNIRSLSGHSSSGGSGWRRSTISNGKKFSLIGRPLPSADRSRCFHGCLVTAEALCADGSLPEDKIRQTQRWRRNNRIFQPETEKTVLNTRVIREVFHDIYRQDHPRKTRRHHFAASNGWLARVKLRIRLANNSLWIFASLVT
jgi:hypothetical protein